MITFLNKIAQVSSVQKVFLLSHQGEVLFYKNSAPSVGIDEQTVSLLHNAVSGLNKPEEATLYCNGGNLYLHQTPIGYIFIAITDDTKLEKLKDACHNGKKKLEQPGVGKKVLLDMLKKTEDTFIPQTMRALVPFADKEVALALIKVISDPGKQSAANQSEIVLTACQALGYCCYFEATSQLQKLLSSHETGTYSLNPFTREAINLSIDQLKQISPEEKSSQQSVPHANASKKVKSTVEKENKPSAVTPLPSVIKELPEKVQIDGLIADNKKNEAINSVLSLIKTATTNREFDKAEALQEWMLQIEPMALAESIRASELIQESKVAVIDEDFYRVWKGIVDILSEEEFIALYHCMECRNYASGEELVKQGQVISELYFVNTGRVQVYSFIDGREIPLYIVQEGGLLGHGTFFELSVWTSGARSQGAEVYALPYENMQKLDKKYPGIESKLFDYCKHLETATTQLQKLKRSRRQLERRALTGKVSFIILGKDGQKTAIEGRGNYLDISQGGVCFTVHSSKRKNSQQLFGKRIALIMKRSHSKPGIERTGKILAVRDHDIIGNAYSVHVQFDTILTGVEMREIIVFGK